MGELDKWWPYFKWYVSGGVRLRLKRCNNIMIECGVNCARFLVRKHTLKAMLPFIFGPTSERIPY